MILYLKFFQKPRNDKFNGISGLLNIKGNMNKQTKEYKKNEYRSNMQVGNVHCCYDGIIEGYVVFTLFFLVLF